MTQSIVLFAIVFVLAVLVFVEMAKIRDMRRTLRRFDNYITKHIHDNVQQAIENANLANIINGASPDLVDKRIKEMDSRYSEEFQNIYQSLKESNASTQKLIDLMREMASQHGIKKSNTNA